MDLTPRQQKIVDLLWDTLRKSEDYPDRADLPSGTKTKLGLAKTVEHIFRDITVLLEAVANSFETEGCEGCGTVDLEVMMRVYEELGFEVPNEWREYFDIDFDNG